MADAFHLYLPNENKEITQSFLESVAVTISINSPYAMMKVILTDINGVLTNTFKVGSPMVLVADVGNYSYNMDFRLLECSRQETSLPSVVSKLTLDLVSSWYFDTRKGKTAYFGTPSVILKEIFEGDEHYTLDVDDCANYSRVFYRLGKPITEYIIDVTNHGYKGGYPMLLYTDMNNIIRYKSVADMYGSEVSHYITQNGASVDGKDLKKVIAPLSLIFGFNVNTSNYLMNYEFSVANFVGNTLMSPFKIGNAEVGSDGVEVPTQETTVYLNWDMTPTDAMGYSIRDSFMKNLNTFNATALILGWEDRLMVGDKVGLISSAKVGDDEEAVGEGNYLVNSITYMYNTSDQIPRTMATFLDANI